MSNKQKYMDFIGIQPPKKSRFELLLESVGRYLKKFSLFKNFAKRIVPKNKYENPIPSVYRDEPGKASHYYNEPYSTEHENVGFSPVVTMSKVEIKLEQITVKEIPKMIIIEPKKITKRRSSRTKKKADIV
jgi:hypothetical protein